MMQGLTPETVQLINYLRGKYGNDFTMTSGYRSPSHNARVGGARRSQHMSGRAFDFNVPRNWRTKELTALVADARAKAQALGIPLSGGYYGLNPQNGHALHFDTRPGGGVTWGADRRGTSTPDWFRTAMTGASGPGGTVAAAGPSSMQTPMVATGPEVFRESGSVPQPQMAQALNPVNRQDPVIRALLDQWTYGVSS